ncbi:MAG: hypothetical protein IJH04_01485, partial [Eggerthellaceae bacterium]|nr:hypothetical protein [Eggerthellaceae bacterium]
GVYFPAGEGYEAFFARREEVENELTDTGITFTWSELDADTKCRTFWVRKEFDYDTQDWTEAQIWMRDMLLRLRVLVFEVFS